MIEINQTHNTATIVEVNGVKISRYLTGYEIRQSAGEIPQISFTMQNNLLKYNSKLHDTAIDKETVSVLADIMSKENLDELIKQWKEKHNE